MARQLHSIFPRGPRGAHKIMMCSLLSLPVCFVFIHPHLHRRRWKKGYGKLPPLDESVTFQICPPTAIGCKVKLAHPFKPCRNTSALAGGADKVKDADKVPFLNSPVSPTGLFAPAVEGFAECFTAAQKSPQAIWHFLPKRSSTAAAPSGPKSALTQQPAKPVPPTAQCHGLAVFFFSFLIRHLRMSLCLEVVVFFWSCSCRNGHRW